MHGTPATSNAPPLLNAWRRLTGALCRPPRHDAPQLVVLALDPHTIANLMIAAFHANWTIRFALSPGDAVALLRKSPSVALVYDWDSHHADWRELCGACRLSGASFHLLARRPPDDLFLAVAGAGGAGVLRKPLNPEQVIAAVGFARNLGAAHPAHPDAAAIPARSAARF
jgi:hypothetical protein